MGEVYRARDTKLNRDVALKVLLPAVANDAERLARFRRESQVLASLSHSKIGAIHALEEGGGTIALVLELVEGPTLADRIARGPIPIDEALPIASQIAEALEAAHDQGIVHRDLKPANIKAREDGTVKVLDFGLAKALDEGSGVRDQGSGGLANSPTITTPAMTQAGMILDTAAYMAPEQAKGHTLDRRADLWAFGAVLFEMLTGARAFKGEDESDTLAAILRADPDWTALPPDTPPLVRRLLRRCLEKDRRRRLDSAAAARLEIDEALTAASAVGSVATPSPGAGLTTPRSAILPWAIALASLVAAGVLLKQVASGGSGPAGGPSAGAARCRSRGGRLVAAYQPRQRRHHFPRRYTDRVRLGFAHQIVHPPAGSTERHRASGNPGSAGPVLVARRTMGRVLRGGKAEQDLRRRWRRRPDPRHRQFRGREAGPRTTASS
jgi:eukaryotic-like serine/threonine-protein kinase